MDHGAPTSRLSLATLRLHWPRGAAFLALGGPASGLTIVATAFREVAFATVKDRTFVGKGSGAPGDSSAPLPFASGIIGVLDYERRRPRCFRVDRALVVDERDGRVWRVGAAGGSLGDGALGIDEAQVDIVVARAAAESEPLADAGLALAPLTTDEHYLQTVRSALSDIGNGRYYQINLLRYFRLDPTPGTSELARRFCRFSGPYGAWVEVPGLSLVSFSPEEFVRVRADDGDPGASGWTVETRPIKGTMARSSDATVDQARAAALLASAKDRAELAMIVDLMRNDLARVAQPGSVRVVEPLRLVSFPTVHHLEAVIAARLSPGVTVGALLDAVCPGGSITGAPKREVMRAIRDYEMRDRGYFMGHAFYLDDRGHFDSSILIRTLVREGGATGGNPYEFAAGSGIVMHSEPETERLEIAAKARVLTAPL